MAEGMSLNERADALEQKMSDRARCAYLEIGVVQHGGR